MIIAIVYGIACVGVGYALIAWMDPLSHFGKLGSCIAALTLGFSAMGFIVLLGALTQTSLANGTTLALIAAALIITFRYTHIRTYVRSYLRRKPHADIPALSITKKEIALLAIPLLLIVLFIFHGMWWTSTGPLTSFKGWGDGAYHLGMVQQFIAQRTFALTHPFLGNTPLIYTFFINLASAILIKEGASISIGWYAPLFLYAAAFVLFLYLLGRELLHKKTLAYLLVLLSLLGAGMGYIWFAQNVATIYTHQGLSAALHVVLNPPLQYTQLDNRTSGIPASQQVPLNIQWIVPIESFFSHQRSFIPGVGLGILLVVGMWVYRNTKTLWKWVGAVGILPLIHSHSFLAVSIIAACAMGAYAYTQWHARRDLWMTIIKSIILFFLLAIPQIMYIQGRVFAPTTGQQPSFMRLWFGWMMCTHTTSWFACDPGIPGTDTSIIIYWIKNFGFIFIGWVTALAYIVLTKDRTKKIIAALSAALFIIPNVMLFQPWEFDNNKFIFYWWMSAIAVMLIAWNAYAATAQKKWIPSILIVMVLIGSFPAGIIDAYSQAKSFITGSEAYTYYGPAQERAAQWIQTHTDPRALFLTAPTPDQFVPLITGRQLYIGYKGWLWSQGGAPIITQRTNTIHITLDAQDPTMLCADGVRYIVDDADFQNAYGTTPITSTLATKVYDADGIAVYALKCKYIP